MRSLPPPSAWSSAFVATLVGFGGTVALVVQAQRALGASVEQVGSAVTASCIGVAVAGGVLSYQLRMPVVLAWSTPGAALLAVAAPVGSYGVAVGAFLLAALATIAVAVIPTLGRWAEEIPPAIGSAMLAGVLLPFCLALFQLGSTDPLLVGLALGVFLVGRQRAPRYAILLVLAAGAVLTWLRGDVAGLAPGHSWGALAPQVPRFDVRAVLGLGVPLFLVTLVSQNLPGLVVLRVAGYQPASRPLLLGTGLASLVTALFGAHAVCLAAITAAICTCEEAHPDRTRRYTVGVLYATFYLALALVAPALVRLFLALPKTAISVFTGVSLIPALLGAVENMLSDQRQREAALITFLAAGSGLRLLGLGSAFWGIVAGLLALGAKTLLRPPSSSGSIA